MEHFDWLRREMPEGMSARASKLEDELGFVGREPILAAWTLREVFSDVVWQDDPPEGHREMEEEELTPEEIAKRREEWDAEMAVFWKYCDELVAQIMGHPNRPEFRPD